MKHRRWTITYFNGVAMVQEGGVRRLAVELMNQIQFEGDRIITVLFCRSCCWLDWLVSIYLATAHDTTTRFKIRWLSTIMQAAWYVIEKCIGISLWCVLIEQLLADCALSYGIGISDDCRFDFTNDRITRAKSCLLWDSAFSLQIMKPAYILMLTGRDPHNAAFARFGMTWLAADRTHGFMDLADCDIDEVTNDFGQRWYFWRFLPGHFSCRH